MAVLAWGLHTFSLPLGLGMILISYLNGETEMSVRTVHTEMASIEAGRNQCHAKIQKHSETGEYRVKFYVQATWQNRSDYFTDDLSDAKQTAAVQCWRGFANTAI